MASLLLKKVVQLAFSVRLSWTLERLTQLPIILAFSEGEIIAIVAPVLIKNPLSLWLAAEVIGRRVVMLAI